MYFADPNLPLGPMSLNIAALIGDDGHWLLNIKPPWRMVHI
jgi:hypothetical protein